MKCSVLFLCLAAAAVAMAIPFHNNTEVNVGAAKTYGAGANPCDYVGRQGGPSACANNTNIRFETMDSTPFLLKLYNDPTSEAIKGTSLVYLAYNHQNYVWVDYPRAGRDQEFYLWKVKIFASPTGGYNANLMSAVNNHYLRVDEYGGVYADRTNPNDSWVTYSVDFQGDAYESEGTIMRNIQLQSLNDRNYYQYLGAYGKPCCGTGQSPGGGVSPKGGCTPIGMGECAASSGVPGVPGGKLSVNSYCYINEASGVKACPSAGIRHPGPNMGGIASTWVMIPTFRIPEGSWVNTGLLCHVKGEKLTFKTEYSESISHSSSTSLSVSYMWSLETGFKFGDLSAKSTESLGITASTTRAVDQTMMQKSGLEVELICPIGGIRLWQWRTTAARNDHQPAASIDTIGTWLSESMPECVYGYCKRTCDNDEDVKCHTCTCDRKYRGFGF